MKKLAFTLMELLMSLAVIGITAALVAPALSNIMPDKTKMQVIKAHKVLADVTHDLLNDPMYYIDGEGSAGTDTYKRPGLSSYTNEGSLYTYLLSEAGQEAGKYIGAQKYCYLLSEKLELDDSIKNSSNVYTFSTVDGVNWSCKAEGSQDTTNKIFLTDYTITIDINGDKDPNTIATSKDVKNPDQFKFNVDTYGKVTAYPDDKLTAQYLKTPTKFNNKKEDYKAAFGS